jgi:hypothetical protein
LAEGLVLKIRAAWLEVAADPIVVRELRLGEDCLMEAAPPLLIVTVGIAPAIEVNAITAV